MYNMGLITHIHQDLVFVGSISDSRAKQTQNTIVLFISRELPCAHRASAGEGNDTFSISFRVAPRACCMHFDNELI